MGADRSSWEAIRTWRCYDADNVVLVRRPQNEFESHRLHFDCCGYGRIREIESAFISEVPGFSRMSCVVFDVSSVIQGENNSKMTYMRRQFQGEFVMDGCNMTHRLMDKNAGGRTFDNGERTCGESGKYHIAAGRVTSICASAARPVRALCSSSSPFLERTQMQMSPGPSTT